MIFVKIFYWILLFISWIATIKYRKVIYDWTGKFAWAEKYLWSWGTVLAITLAWMAMIFLSIAYPAWVFDKDEETAKDQKLEQWSTSKEQKSQKQETWDEPITNNQE